MTHIVNVVNKETGVEEPLIFNNEDTSLTDRNGNDFLDRVNVFAYPETGVKQLAVSLGFKCNMDCSYCDQHLETRVPYDPVKVGRLIQQMRKLDLTETHVEFWGGEPLLYLTEIEHIVDVMKETTGSYGLVTNGLLLTLDRAKWLMDNKFTIALSHDAQGHDERGIDTLDKPRAKEALLWIIDNYPDRISLNSVLTNKNINTRERIKWFEDKLGRNLERVSHAGEGFAYNMPKGYIDTSNLVNLVKQDLDDMGMRYIPHHNKVRNTIKNFFGKRKKETLVHACGANGEDNYKVISLEGRGLTCHCSPSEFSVKAVEQHNKCSQCLVLSTCSAGCPIHEEDSEMFEANCSLYYPVNEAYFRKAIELMSEDQYSVTTIESERPRNFFYVKK